jgi:hypothetical protein
MNNLALLSAAIMLLGFTGCTPKPAQDVVKARKLEIKEGAYFINGEKTFINALGYEIAARPGQHPYEDEKVLEIARMRHDLKVIKEAGFNAVRTWSELTEEEVKLIQESGLMLVYGIWMLPHGDFDDPKFVADAHQQVRNVMAWSKNYDCIITYLIMNEPMVEHIIAKGAQNTFDLWTSVTEIIHELHPGIPVTISNNSGIGEYLNERIFDVYGFNTYDYLDGLQGYTQGFANHFKYLKELNGENKPVLVTEFGMSVSPIGWGLYGGNTRERQASHVVQNFSDVLDSEVAGICPFYYADGWWKAGEPAIHNPLPEEWFGYWGYADDKDTIGYPRPIWYEFAKYNKAIVASPRNQKIYQGAVPFEFFLGDAVSKIKVVYNDKVIYDSTVSAYHFTDAFDFNEQAITDRELIFEFYNKNNELLKWESIMILTTKNEIKLPEISLTLSADNLENVKKLSTTFTVTNDTIFKLDKQFKYAFAPHQGWDGPELRLKEIATDKPEVTITDTYDVLDKYYVLNIAAGIDIKYGKFVKRIHTEKLVYRGTWADPIKVD